jgi:hypothetical protein
MSNIIVTTPKTELKRAEQEAQDCINNGGGEYFRRLGGRSFPKRLGIGDRIYYVQDGYIRGFSLVSRFEISGGEICDTSGEQYGSGHYVFCDATTWQWVVPTPMKGFQGYRYTNAIIDTLRVVGKWKDPKPEAFPSGILTINLS